MRLPHTRSCVRRVPLCPGQHPWWTRSAEDLPHDTPPEGNRRDPDRRTAAPGIPHPDGSGRWLVPPWPLDVAVTELVQHFQRYQPAVHACSAIQAAYYSGYAAVLAATPSGKLAETLSWQWYAQLLSAISRAAASAEAEQAEAALDTAKTSMQLSLVRMFGLNSLPVDGQAR